MNIPGKMIFFIVKIRGVAQENPWNEIEQILGQSVLESLIYIPLISVLRYLTDISVILITGYFFVRFFC